MKAKKIKLEAPSRSCYSPGRTKFMKGRLFWDPKKIIMPSLMAFLLCVSGCKKVMMLQENADALLSSEQASVASSVPDFTIAVIPDTQYYTSTQYGGVPAMFTSQIDWIKANQATENIVYVAGVGDITDHGDTYTSEWTNATTNGYYKLESQAGFTQGIPYGVAVGNHDQSPNTGHPLTCSTAKFNTYFGRSHFAGRYYYGGNYAGSGSNNNDSHYDLIRVGTAPNIIDLVIIYIEYDSHNDDPAVNDWAKDVLAVYSHCKGIIVTHDLMNGGIGTVFNTQGQNIYDQVKYRENCFLMLSGHTGPTGRRADTYTGNTINTVMQDYQCGTANCGGGSGWMRLFKFSPDNNTISVRTISPYLGIEKSATDNNNTFSLQMFSHQYQPPTVLNPIEDAFVRDGSYVNTNYGTAQDLIVKSGNTGFHRQANFKFDLSGITGTIYNARLRVYGSNIENSTTMGIRAYSIDDLWTETGLTWANDRTPTYITSDNVNNQARYYEWDVTAYIKAQKAGDGIASLKLAQYSGSNLTTSWNSREKASNKPELVITYE